MSDEELEKIVRVFTEYDKRRWEPRTMSTPYSTATSDPGETCDAPSTTTGGSSFVSSFMPSQKPASDRNAAWATTSKNNKKRWERVILVFVLYAVPETIYACSIQSIDRDELQSLQRPDDCVYGSLM